MFCWGLDYAWEVLCFDDGKMMVSKVGSRNGDGHVSSNSGQLLRDIEAIRKALYLHKTHNRLWFPHPVFYLNHLRNPICWNQNRVWTQKVSIKTCHLRTRNLHRHELEDGKAHIGCQEFNICFFLHVHSIEGLPPSFNGVNLSVHWTTKDVVFRTRAAKVLKGMDEFDQTLMHKCSIYGK